MRRELAILAERERLLHATLVLLSTDHGWADVEGDQEAEIDFAAQARDVFDEAARRYVEALDW
jgi:hypothetical protein